VSFVGRVMVFLRSVVLGFITKPLTMIRLFAELFGHYPGRALERTGRSVFALSAVTWPLGRHSPKT
jgi:hypothetical protein